MSLLGIILNPLSAGMLFSPTPETTDTYNLNNYAQDSGSTTAPLNSVQAVHDFLNGWNSQDPAQYFKGFTNLGITYGLPGNKVMEWTTLTTDPHPGQHRDYIVIEVTPLGLPSQIKLEAVVGQPYAGAPLVSNVHAEQVQGSKNVRIDFSVLLGDSDTGFGGEKPSFLEFWFKSDPSSPQWEICHTFESAGGGSPSGSANLITPGALSQSGGYQAIWRAGDQKPNFQTATGKIRVLVTYDHQDPNNPGGGMTQGSGWDGYEAANGPMFTNSTANTTKISYPYNKTSFFNWLNDPANNISIGITRQGSFNNNGEMDPVYQFSAAQLTNLTNGITGHHPGKYALGLAVDPGGVTGYHFIPVE